MRKKYVKKAAGGLEPFSKKKLYRFLNRIEVPQKHINRIASEIDQSLSEQGATTSEISRLVSNQLQQIENGEVYVARYNLKSAIRKMGPAGHNFEKYVGRLFIQEGFNVEVGIEVQGECVKHEIDVVAKKKNELHLVEAKFHNQEGIRSDVTVVLYVYSRFMDIARKVMKPDHTEHVWIATNTKLTTTAFRYASCRGIRMLSIEQPYNNSIMDKVIKHGLFPISTIGMLDPFLEKMFAENIVTLSDLVELDYKEIDKLQLPKDLFGEAQAQAMRILDFTST